MTGLTSPSHIAIVLVVLLLVFGAKRLPELGRSLGHGMREFKDTLSGADHPEVGPGPDPDAGPPRQP
jgi:sec-independent protein translocase protein TatA